MKAILVGRGATVPGGAGRIWNRSKVYVHPMIDGISDNLWRKIYNETCEAKPMYGKDGSAVYADGYYRIVRKIGNEVITIASVTEVG